MKQIFLTLALMAICGPLYAATLDKQEAYDTHWQFTFSTTVNKEKHTIEIPIKKCVPSRPKLDCYSTQKEATRAAVVKAKTYEKKMSDALSNKTTHTK